MTRLERLGFGVLIALHLGVNAALWYCSLEFKDHARELAPFLFGITLGQIVLLGLWLALVALPLPVRLIGAGCSGAMLWISSSGVVRAFDLFDVKRSDPWLLIMLGFELLVGTLACWGFFAVLWRWLRWQIRHRSHIGEPQISRFHLQQVMIAMGMICLVLGFGRAALPLSPQFTWENMKADQILLFLLGMAVMHLVALVLLLFNLALILPSLVMLRAAMQHRSRLVSFALAVATPFIYAAAVTLAQLGALLNFLNVAGDQLGFALLGFNGAQFTTILVTIVLLRPLGFCFEHVPQCIASRSESAIARASECRNG